MSESASSYGGFVEPEPEPQQTFKVYETEPAIVDVANGGGGSLGTMSADLSVLQTPMLVPMSVRLAPPRPLAEPVPAAPNSRVLGGASAGAPVATIRGSVTQTVSQIAEQPSGATASPTGNVAMRQGFPEYLRNARTVELASIALPGVAGLLAITAGGGIIGYRQANSVRYVRADSARFLT